MKNFILSVIVLTFAFSAFAAQTAVLKIKTKDGKTSVDNIELRANNGFDRLEIPIASIPDNVETVELIPDFAKAKIGDDGYFLMPNGMSGFFKARDKDAEYVTYNTPLALTGMKIGDSAFAAIVKGLRHECKSGVRLKNGVYSIFFRFNLKNDKPYENIVIDFYQLKGGDANYSAMGRLYRNWQLERGEVRPLRERAIERPVLAYTANAPEIRIRLGWKPVPSPVLHQTLETEPKMKVAMTFERVGELIDEMQKQGIGKAEICLVGWNIRGHDGRWPTIFPVEPALGGESKLRELISKAKSCGYKIVCHTNSGDAYEVSPDWNPEYIAKKPDGTLQNNATWSGGQMFNVCYKEYSDRFLKRDYPLIKDLGFEGLHYIDVLSTVRPTVCYDKKHPQNRNEAAKQAELHLKYAADLMGGCASEGGFDHVASVLDYGLYITFNLMLENKQPLIDRYLPVWHIVYNGIIMSNAGTATINYTIKDDASRMKVTEFGTRPSFYLYSAFVTPSKKRGNWMGKDIICDTDTDLKNAVAEIKKGFEHCEKFGYLQYEFLEYHGEIAPDVFKSEFSDGSVIISNYSKSVFNYDGKDVPSMACELFKPRGFFDWLF